MRAREGPRRLAAGESGQMTVELAVLVPVALVVALTVYNLLGFVDACAAFDRVSLDAVVAHGVAPSGEEAADASASVAAAIEQGLGRSGSCEVSVVAEGAQGGGETSTFVISPLLTRYVCTLTYKTWPRYLRMPGITLEAPFALTHERTLVVDRYRPGVVM